MPDPELLAERYMAAVDGFIECVRKVPGDGMDFQDTKESWSPRDICFHVADVDSMLGLRLRRILGENYPQLAGIDTQASVKLYRRSRLDTGLALDALSANSALTTGLIEKLTPEGMARKGRHSEGHDVTAADLAAFMAMHIEAHIKQVKRTMAAARK
ncbi:MAG: DinB family protein [Planctomycetes bacterium]|nr:DinB family protein [Planctomycetota bacterium]